MMEDVLLSQTCWIKVLGMHSRVSLADTTDGLWYNFVSQ